MQPQINRIIKIGIIVICMALVIGAGFWLVLTRSNQPTNSTKLQIRTSIYPLADFVHNVGKDLVEVKTITPPGSEPHDYEPTARDIIEVIESDLFIFNGAGIDPWVHKAAEEAKSKGVSVLQTSEFVQLLPTTHDQHKDHHSEEHEEDKQTEESEQDPHFWLDPIFAKTITQKITDLLVEKDPRNAQTYRQNNQSFQSKLATIDQEFQKLQTCKNRTIITSHQAFAYLAKRYQFEVISISGINPEQEPSIARLTEITNLIREKKVKHIYLESRANSRLTDTISQETGASVLSLNPIETLTTAQIQAGKSYLSIMNENIDNLILGFECTL